MYEADDEHSHTMAAAVSAGWPTRPSGTFVWWPGPIGKGTSGGTSQAERSISVSMKPDLTAFTRMSCWPRTLAAALVSPSTPALDVE